MNWRQVEAYLEREDRIVLPLGSTEQHAYLSVATDSVIAERLAVDAAEPLGVAVLPALAYGVTPYFAAYPGSPSVDPETYLALLSALLASLRGQGFRRVLLLNGHGGNTASAEQLVGDGVVLHSWWTAPRTRAAIDALDPDASHASWMENFPWTRLPGVELPPGKKEPSPRTSDDPAAVRAALGDGCFGGFYELPDEDVLGVWAVAVEEARAALEALSS
jgi:creatinine amidohydrolase